MPTDEPQGCGRPFAEEMLSGYLDGVLTQADRQQVRLHLEDCAHCRGLVEGMNALRATAANTAFLVPDDGQWNELPKSSGSRWLRTGGWTMLIAWAVAVTAFLGWQLATGHETLWQKLLVFGALAGGLFLFLSVLLDRLRTLPGDRYRRVQK
ncbi:MAG: zf-HC2 domain-containing protein [Acidobacteriota bacterium]